MQKTYLYEPSRNSDGKQLTNENQTIEETFDVVIICIGHLSAPYMPKITGMEKFKGVKVHSGDYRTFHPYVGKRVVVVGCSYSAGTRVITLISSKRIILILNITDARFQ
jgi:cation diffusion facilitator CzcD-associated flavoprotein CzcO